MADIEVLVPPPIVIDVTQAGPPLDGGSSGPADWNTMLNKPTEFPPEAHTQGIATITGLTAALTAKQETSAKDQANGYAGLDGSGKINPSQLPPIAITDSFPVASQAAMLALTAERGDIAIRSDINKTFVLGGGGSPSTLADWLEMKTPTDTVTSIFARTGNVTAQNGDYTTTQVTEGTNLYFTTARVLATALASFAVAPGRTAVVAADTVLQAFGKIQKYLNDLGDAAFAAASAAGLAMLTAANVAAQTALLDAFTTTLKGLVPAPGTIAGKFLRDDGTWAAAGGSGAQGPSKFVYFTDFMTVVADDTCASSVSGTGAANAAQPWQFAGNPVGSGFVRVALGTVATNRAAWFTAVLITFYVRVAATVFRIRGGLMNVSNATNTWTAWLGFLDAISVAPGSGVFFRYTHSVNGGRWEAVCRNVGTETAVDTGVAADLNGNHTWEIQGSANGNSMAFYIDGNLVATITTNLPPVGTTLGFGYNFIRTVGTAAVNAASFDYLMVTQDYASRN